MLDIENQSPSRPKSTSSRRRRWEVKSRDSFEKHLAVEIDYPDKIQLRKNSNNDKNKKIKRERPKSCLKKEKNKPEPDNEVKADNMSIKLSSLLDDAVDKSKNSSENNSHLRGSDENLIKSELNEYFNTLDNSESEPSAPPLTPPDGAKKPAKKKVSVQVKPIHSGVNVINSKITQHLNQLSEDVIDEKKVNKDMTTIPGVAVSGLLIGPSSSSTFNGNVSTIYCERLNNFVISSEENLIKSVKNEPLRDPSRKETMKSHALFLQTGFRTFCVLCQGILAGISMAHCLMVFMFQEATDVLLENSLLEHTFFTLTIFLSFICLISAFDRCDLAGQDVLTEHGIRIPWTPLFYIISMILTLVMIRAEDFVTHFNMYPEKIQSKEVAVLQWWKYMCLARTSFAVVGWVAVAADPHTDVLVNRIKQLGDE